MDQSARTAPQQLEDCAVRINAESDRLSVSYGKINEYLQSLNLGVTAFIDTGSGYKIGYGKINGQWGLMLSHNEDKWPILEAPRMPRAHAMRHVPELIKELARLATLAVETISAAADFDWRASDAHE